MKTIFSTFSTKRFFVPAIAAAIGAVLTILLLACASAPRADFGGLGRASDTVPLTNRAITGTLPNGLQYFILENRRPENRALLSLVVNAGSVVERDDERGFAHFVEHMAFRGTARFPETELLEYLRSLGMRFGPDVNAFVSFNETVYHFDVPVEVVDGVRRIPEKALALLDDWSHAVSFKPEAVDLERLVILEEYRGRLGAMERARRIMWPILFAGSAYADRHPIGVWEIIENATAEQLRAFYQRWYRSDNMALIFVGDFDGPALQASLASHFTIPKAAEPVNRPVFSLPPPRSGNFHVEFISDPELTSVEFSIYYKQRPGAPRGTIGHFRETVIDHLIHTMLSMRFQEDLARPEAAAVSSWGSVWRWSRNARFYGMGTQPRTGQAEAAFKELLLAKESMRRHGFTEDELSRAKIRLLSSMEQQLAERDNQNSRQFLRGFTNHFLLGQAMADIEWELEAVRQLLPGISTREITAAVRSYFAPNDITVFVLTPEAELPYIPSADRIRAMFREASRARVEPRVFATLTGELLEAPPLPGTIISESVDSETGAHILHLSNGANVILKETQNRNNEIILYAGAIGGTANAGAAGENASVSARLASEMLAISGLGPFSRTELMNILTGRQVSLSFWASDFQRGFQGSSTTQDIRTLFEMLYLNFTNPRLDENAISAMIAQHRTLLARQEDDPQRAFRREITRTITNNHFHFRPLELADMDRVSIELARAFITDSLNPGDFTFTFIGNIDINEMRELAAAYIASIPNSRPIETWADLGMSRPGPMEMQIHMGIEERSMVYLGWFVPNQHSFCEERNQHAAVLNEYLNILLIDEIRENMGGVYSIHAGVSVSTIPRGEYRLTVFFNCDPARARELIGAVKNIMDQLVNQGLDQGTFNKAKEALLRGHETAMQRNLHIAQSYINSFAFFNTPLSRLDNRPQAIRAVRPENVQALAREILRGGPIQIVLFPEGWTE